ncbi:MAG: hypothetical protein WC318_05235 [Candidatus Omnitrophota bacterium]|jgi:hypothetical protein
MRSRTKKKFIKIFFILSVSILLGFFIYSSSNPLNKRTIVSPNILLLTNPVHNFCGKVQKIDKEAFWLAKTVYTQEKSSAPVKENTLTYKITIDEQTKLQNLFAPIPYLFKVNPGVRAAYIKPDLRKFKTGQIINVTFKEDLRRYLKDTFTAEYVYFSPVTNSVFGVISQVEQGSLRLQSFSRMPLPPSRSGSKESAQLGQVKEKIYTVQVTPDTEISWLDNTNPAEPKAVKLDFGELTAGLPVMVYTNVDVEETDSIVALLINPKVKLSPQKK